MRKRHRPNWPLRLCIGSVLVAALVHMLAEPTVELLRNPSGDSPSDHALRWSMFADSVVRHGLESVVGVWILFLGASIGSFLNVVVYRLPLGRSLVAKGSFCPHCRVPIRSSDNIPVVGWLKLRGRCRACRLPISPRYPIVEAWVGILYFVLFVVEIAGGGSNLPGVNPGNADGIADVVMEGRWDLCGLFLFHAILFSVFVPAILIRWDGHRLPAKLVGFGFVFPAIMAFLFPWLIDWLNGSRQVLPLSQDSLYPWAAMANWTADTAQQESVRSAVTFAAGAIVGLVVGGLIGSGATRLGWRIQRPGSEARSAMFGFVLCGVFMGWQSVFAVALWWVVVLAVVTCFAFRASPLRDVSIVAWIALAAFIHLISWRATSYSEWMPTETVQVRWLLFASLVSLAGTILLVTLRSRLYRVAAISARTSDDLKQS